MSGGYESVLLALLAISSVTDLLWGKIYNAVTFPFLALGLGAQFYFGGLKAGGGAIAAVVIAFALFFPLWRLKVLAAGDVKLLMAAGSFLAPFAILELALLSVLIGGMVGAMVLVRNSGLRGSVASLRDHLIAMPVKSHRMPFGPAMLSAFFVMQISKHYGWNIL